MSIYSIFVEESFNNKKVIKRLEEKLSEINDKFDKINDKLDIILTELDIEVKEKCNKSNEDKLELNHTKRQGTGDFAYI